MRFSLLKKYQKYEIDSEKISINDAKPFLILYSLNNQHKAVVLKRTLDHAIIMSIDGIEKTIHDSVRKDIHISLERSGLSSVHIKVEDADVRYDVENCFPFIVQSGNPIHVNAFQRTVKRVLDLIRNAFFPKTIKQVRLGTERFGQQFFRQFRVYATSHDQYHYNHVLNKFDVSDLYRLNIDYINVGIYQSLKPALQRLFDEEIALDMEKMNLKELEGRSFNPANDQGDSIRVQIVKIMDSLKENFKPEDCERNLSYLQEIEKQNIGLQTLCQLVAARNFVEIEEFYSVYLICKDADILGDSNNQLFSCLFAYMELLQLIEGAVVGDAGLSLKIERLCRVIYTNSEVNREDFLRLSILVAALEIAKSLGQDSGVGWGLHKYLALCGSELEKLLDEDLAGEKFDRVNYQLGLVRVMQGRPRIAAKHFSVASSYPFVTKTIHCLTLSGNLTEAIKLSEKCFQERIFSEADEAQSLNLKRLYRWKDEELFKYVSYDSEGTGYRQWGPEKLKVFNGTNVYQQESIFLGDHNFQFQIEFSFFSTSSRPLCFASCGTDGWCLLLHRDKVRLELKNYLGATLHLTNNCRLKPGPNKVVLERTEGCIILCVNGINVQQEIHSEFLVLGGMLQVSELLQNRSVLLGKSKTCGKVQGFKLNIARYAKESFSKRLYIYSSWYGDDFTELFFSSLKNSLRRSDGLLTLKENLDITWMIYISEEQKEKVTERVSEISELCDEIVINTQILGSELYDPRTYLHLSFLDVVEVAAKDKSLILFAPPDHIFGEGLSRLVENSSNDEYWVCGHPRISFESCYKKGEWTKLIEDDQGLLSNSGMVKKALDFYPHNLVKYGKHCGVFDPANNEESHWWNIDEREKYFAANFKEPPPVLLRATRDIIAAIISDGNLPGFERVDHDLVEWMWRTKRLRMVTNSSDFFWVEFCRDARNYPTITNDYWPQGARDIYRTELKWLK